jgi:hypothetical protein
MRSGLFLTLLLVLFHSTPASSVPAPGPEAFGYSVSITTAFSFTNVSDGTRILYFTDDEATTINIGFNFNFYGVNYTSVSCSPNGLMTFGGPSADFNNVDVSAAVAPTNNLPCIAVLWDDWETESLGADAIYYKTLGTEGSRQFIVQWNNVMPVNGMGTNTVTFQARLFEASNQILLSYLDVVVSDDPSYGNGAFATVGIRDIGGQTNNRNLLWSYNQAVITNRENILFTRTNHMPIAVADTLTTIEDSPGLINVLANDNDTDGNLLTILSVTQGTKGSVITNGGPTITYLPNTNFNGTDSFVYRIGDGQGGFATNTVSVSVVPVNDQPQCAADFYDTHQNVSLTLKVADLLTNDLDIDGDPLTLTSVSNPTAAGSKLTWTNTTILYSPPANFSGTDAFNYSANDGHGGSGSALVNIKVWPLKVVSITRQTPGTLSVQFVGIPSRTYCIQSSSNLVDWASVALRSADANGRFSFEQYSVSALSPAFFRALSCGP